MLVDQFEEIFRYRGRALSSEERRRHKNDAIAFVNLMLSTARARNERVYVSLTVRTDFLGECDAFHGFAQTTSSSLYLPPRLTRDELREVIELPLK